MKILVQWTRLNPLDWEEIDSADWPSLSTRPVPASGEFGGADDAPGWILALDVQGVVFSGHDHYSVEDIPGGCRVTVWDDDPDDPAPTPYVASRWTFLDPAPDLRYGGQVNTRQTVEFWHDEPILGSTSGGLHVTHPRIEFVAPPNARHGVWVTDEKLSEHVARQSVRVWTEWVR